MLIPLNDKDKLGRKIARNVAPFPPIAENFSHLFLGCWTDREHVPCCRFICRYAMGYFPISLHVEDYKCFDPNRAYGEPQIWWFYLWMLIYRHRFLQLVSCGSSCRSHCSPFCLWWCQKGKEGEEQIADNLLCSLWCADVGVLYLQCSALSHILCCPSESRRSLILSGSCLYPKLRSSRAAR